MFLFVHLFVHKSPNVWHFICIHTEKHILHMAKLTFIFFLLEIGSCSRDWYWNFSMFFDELWNNKKKVQSLLTRNQKVKAVAQVWGMSNQFPHMHLNGTSSVQTRHVGRKRARNDRKLAADIHKEGAKRSNQNDFIFFCFPPGKKHRTLESVVPWQLSSFAPPSTLLSTVHIAVSKCTTCDGFRVFSSGAAEVTLNTCNLSGTFTGNAFEG